MSTELQGAISSAISQANDKAAQKSEGSFTEQVAKDRVATANNRISVAESKVNRNQGQMADIQQQIETPPTEEKVQGDGKNQKTVTQVDQAELRKLNTQKNDIQTQLAQAQQEVQKAQADAQAAASEAIKQTGVNAGTQSEMDALMAKANNIKNTLSQGGKVDDKEIKDLTDRFGKVAGGLTAENNPGGLLSTAFYKPMADTLKNIDDLLKKAPVNDATVDPSKLPPANKQLHDVGITNLEQQNKFISFNTEVNKFAKGIQDNQGKFDGEFTQDKFKEIIAKNTEQRAPLNDTQKNTGVIKQNDDTINAIKTSTGFAG
jgi:predicted  nucleic acid-binding Zn-ribbon protein